MTSFKSHLSPWSPIYLREGTPLDSAKWRQIGITHSNFNWLSCILFSAHLFCYHSFQPIYYLGNLPSPYPHYGLLNKYIPWTYISYLLWTYISYCRGTNQYRKRRMTKNRYLIRIFLKKLKTSPKMPVSALNRFFYYKFKNSHVFDPISPLQKIVKNSIFLTFFPKLLSRFRRQKIFHFKGLFSSFKWTK